MPYMRVKKGSGGYVIAAESPTGERIEDGGVFIAPPSWAELRVQCSFLETIARDVYEAAVSGEPEPEPESEPPSVPDIPESYQQMKSLAYAVAKERGDELESFTADYLRAYLELALEA